MPPRKQPLTTNVFGQRIEPDTTLCVERPGLLSSKQVGELPYKECKAGGYVWHAATTVGKRKTPRRAYCSMGSNQRCVPVSEQQIEEAKIPPTQVVLKVKGIRKESSAGNVYTPRTTTRLETEKPVGYPADQQTFQRVLQTARAMSIPPSIAVRPASSSVAYQAVAQPPPRAPSQEERKSGSKPAPIAPSATYRPTVSTSPPITEFPTFSDATHPAAMAPQASQYDDEGDDDDDDQSDKNSDEEGDQSDRDGDGGDQFDRDGDGGDQFDRDGEDDEDDNLTPPIFTPPPHRMRRYRTIRRS